MFICTYLFNALGGYETPAPETSTADCPQVHGGTAEADGRLMKGDQILSVNGQDLKSASQEEAAAVLKTVAGKVTMKLGRLKAARKAAANGTDK